MSLEFQGSGAFQNVFGAGEEPDTPDTPSGPTFTAEQEAQLKVLPPFRKTTRDLVSSATDSTPNEMLISTNNSAVNGRTDFVGFDVDDDKWLESIEVGDHIWVRRGSNSKLIKVAEIRQLVDDPMIQCWHDTPIYSKGLDQYGQLTTGSATVEFYPAAVLEALGDDEIDGDTEIALVQASGLTIVNLTHLQRHLHAGDWAQFTGYLWDTTAASIDTDSVGEQNNGQFVIKYKAADRVDMKAEAVVGQLIEVFNANSSKYIYGRIWQAPSDSNGYLSVQFNGRNTKGTFTDNEAVTIQISKKAPGASDLPSGGSALGTKIYSSSTAVQSSQWQTIDHIFQTSDWINVAWRWTASGGTVIPKTQLLQLSDIPAHNSGDWVKIYPQTGAELRIRYSSTANKLEWSLNQAVAANKAKVDIFLLT